MRRRAICQQGAHLFEIVECGYVAERRKKDRFRGRLEGVQGSTNRQTEIASSQHRFLFVNHHAKAAGQYVEPLIPRVTMRLWTWTRHKRALRKPVPTLSGENADPIRT